MAVGSARGATVTSRMSVTTVRAPATVTAVGSPRSPVALGGRGRDLDGERSVIITWSAGPQ